MSTVRIFICDIEGCGLSQQEEIFGQGPRDFGQFNGIILNGVSDPMLCPGHRAMAADFICMLKGKPKAVDITEGNQS